jgi:hypothetical protein
MLAVLVVFYLMYRKRAAPSDTGTGTAILTTGVLPQGVSQAGAPASNAAPSSGLSPDVQDALSSQFGDINTALAGLAAGQSQLQTDLDTQAAAAAQQQSDMSNALATQTSSITDFENTVLGTIITTLRPPTATGVNSTPTPKAAATHAAKKKTPAKPTMKTAKAKPKGAVRTKAKVTRKK